MLGQISRGSSQTENKEKGSYQYLPANIYFASYGAHVRPALIL